MARPQSVPYSNAKAEALKEPQLACAQACLHTHLLCGTCHQRPRIDQRPNETGNATPGSGLRLHCDVILSGPLQYEGQWQLEPHAGVAVYNAKTWLQSHVFFMR